MLLSASGLDRSRALSGAALTLCVAALVTPRTGTAQQNVIDGYWSGTSQVTVRMNLDSLAVKPVGPSPADGLDSILEGVIPGAVRARPISGSGWMYWFPPISRAELATAAKELGENPQIEWAGLVIWVVDGSPDPALVTDEFLVQFLPGVTPAEVEELNASENVETVRAAAFPGDHYVLRVTQGDAEDALQKSNTYQQDSRVEYAHPNFIRLTGPGAAAATEVVFEEQWHLRNEIYDMPLAIRPDVHAYEAWTITRGDPNIVIAVIEFDGFDTDHPDLTGRAWINEWETSPPPGNEPLATSSKSGDLHGWSFEGCTSADNAVYSGCGTPDIDLLSSVSFRGHGTQVAAMAAASDDDDLGVRGVCPQCSLMYLRLGSSPPTDLITAAFDYARIMGADIINASFHDGIPDPTMKKVLERTAAEGRGQLGIPIVTMPSNVPGNFDWDFCPPGGLFQVAQFEVVISVTRTDYNDIRHLGATGDCKDLLAPGDGVTTADPVGMEGDDLGDFYTGPGNSFAVPVVAGTIGLMLSVNPYLTRQQVYDVLTQTADKIDTSNGDPYVSGFSRTHGYGRVNAYNAVAEALSLFPSAPPPPPASAEWEVGVRAGMTLLDVEGADLSSVVDLPGGGPLGDPVVYVSYVTPGFLVDGQLGFNRTDDQGALSTPPGAGEVRRLSLAALAAVRVGNLYGGLTVGFQDLDSPTLTRSAWGFGPAVGFRYAFGPFFVARIEALYRHWSQLSVNEWGLALALGVHF